MEPLPIACSLGPTDLEGRRKEWAEVLSHSTRRDTVPGGVTIALPDDARVSATIASLMEKEQSCCGWMSMELAAGPSGRILRITSRDPMGERQIREWF
jgi:hypothetical protein